MRISRSRDSAAGFRVTPRIDGTRIFARLIQNRGKSLEDLRLNEAAHSVGAGLAAEPAEPDEIVEMSKRLADREGELVEVELAAEQDREKLRRRARLDAGRDRAREPLVMVLRELVEAEPKPAEGEAVGGQHEH